MRKTKSEGMKINEMKMNLLTWGVLAELLSAHTKIQEGKTWSGGLWWGKRKWHVIAGANISYAALIIPRFIISQTHLRNSAKILIKSLSPPGHVWKKEAFFKTPLDGNVELNSSEGHRKENIQDDNPQTNNINWFLLFNTTGRKTMLQIPEIPSCIPVNILHWTTTGLWLQPNRNCAHVIFGTTALALAKLVKPQIWQYYVKKCYCYYCLVLSRVSFGNYRTATQYI